MKFYELKQQLAPLIVFSLQDVYLVDPSFRQATLYDWCDAGKVCKLKNNRYIFADFIPADYDFYLLSNLLYKPSYVSTELALNHFNVIPELVTVITAVTTNKTQSFVNQVGTFSYQSIRPNLFFGYTLIEIKNHRGQIATLEKAILDYLYLNPNISTSADFESLRWNQQVLRDEINQNLLEKYATVFSSQSLSNRVTILYKYLKG